jgi:hypothetical protein
MSPTPTGPPGEPAESAPGKVRTWWHPLLAGLLRWQLGDRYELEEEVNVGQKPLQIDILLLLQKGRGELPEAARRVLAGLAEYLGERTLVEFKSPSDTLREGDFQTLLAYAFLYRAQRGQGLPPGQMHLIVLAPRLTRPYRFKARQTKLNRLVALKMILAGGHAGEAELARFRTEAEATARLRGPPTSSRCSRSASAAASRSSPWSTAPAAPWTGGSTAPRCRKRRRRGWWRRSPGPCRRLTRRTPSTGT